MKHVRSAEERAIRHRKKHEKEFPGIPYKGYIFSKQARENIAKSQRECQGTPEAKERTSLALKKNHLEHPERSIEQSKALKVYYEDPEARKKNSEAQKLIKGTIESRTQHSKALKVYFEDPEARKKNSEAQKRVKSTLESRTQHSKAMLDHYQAHPETPGRISKANRDYYLTHPEARKKVSMARQGITNPDEWPGFLFRGKYCWKWTDPRLKIKKRVRAFFGNKCIVCHKTKVENHNAHLSVNHVGNNKQACCEDNPHGWLFVPLCSSCHGRSSGTKQEAADIAYTKLINTKYGGKCYYSLEEYDRLVREGKLRTEDYGRKDGK